ncbi:MAG: DUF4411 family protein [Candidatus Daviesbacteria bacterium]|nr:DUF4411 family protein [Candidatus Daviesbacteria bacterium]
MQENLFSTKAIYIIDSSAIILLRQFYPKDIFDPLHNKICDILRLGKVVILDLVFDEIKKETDLYKLFKSVVPKDKRLNYGDYVDTTQDILLKYYDGHGGTHNLRADPHIIGCAKIENLTVVTEELSSGLNTTSMPYVCNSEGIPCISFVDFLRKEKVKLD